MPLDRTGLDRWFSGYIRDFVRAMFLQDILDRVDVAVGKSFLRLRIVTSLLGIPLQHCVASKRFAR